MKLFRPVLILSFVFASLLVRAADNEGLRRVVLEKLQAIPEVLGTRTALIFEDLGTL